MRALLALPFLLAACGSDDPDMLEPGVITVEITSPKAGAELLAADTPTIEIDGTVASTNPGFGILQVFVNGTQVDLVDGKFTATLEPEVGINHIAVQANDGFGQVVARELDVVWAPEYLTPIAGTTGFDVTGGIELRLGQRFFDARPLGTSLDLTTDPAARCSPSRSPTRSPRR
jgi:Glucodextranase, domain B